MSESKPTAWRIIDVALVLVVGLSAALWGITWKATDKAATEARTVAQKACDEVQLTKEFIAAQKEINKNMDEKLDTILREVRRGNK